MSAAFDRLPREGLWREHGASEDQARELVAYAAGPLRGANLLPRSYPLPDAACAASWERYAAEAEEEGALPVLRRVLVQLRFPISAGVRGTTEYQMATRRGSGRGLLGEGAAFVDPGGLRIFLHPTAAGRVAVILARAREDFETLVRAITCGNEPMPVPPSMGACLVAGYNNWDRVAALRRGWEAECPAGTEESWAAAFRDLIPRKELYQDRFMVLSSGPYSGTPAAALGLDEDGWRSASITLRLEHECTHFVMRQALGAMKKSLLDEMIADYMGLHEALGDFRSDVFLRFLGLESFPRYRAGGRLENYRGSPPLSDGAFRVLQSVATAAAESLGRIDAADAGVRFSVVEKARRIVALALAGVEGLASIDAPALMSRAQREAADAVLPAPGFGPDAGSLLLDPGPTFGEVRETDLEIQNP